MDMTALLNAIRDLGIAALPFVAAWVGTHVKNATTRNAIDDAVKRAGGIAYHYLVARASGMTATDARARALNEGVNYLQTRVPELLQEYGVDSTGIRDMVTAELGKLLAADPNVVPNVQSATPPVVVPAMPPSPTPAPPKPPGYVPPPALGGAR